MQQLKKHDGKKASTKLQEIREEKGLSKYRLAQLSGLSITHICNIESGKKDIEDMSLKNIKKLAKGLMIDYTDLIN